MAFRLKRSESIQAGFARLAEKQIQLAIDRIEAAHAWGAAGIASARTPLTRLYTLFYLLRPGFDQAAYKHQTKVLRSALESLKHQSQPDQLLQTLDSLRQKAVAQRNADPWDNLQHWLVDGGDFVPLEHWENARAWLVARRQPLLPPNGDSPWPNLATQLRQTQSHLEKIEVKTKGWQALAPGLERLYRRGRKGLPCGKTPNPDNGVSPWPEGWDHWLERLYCQTQLLHGLWPRAMGATAQEQKRLLAQLRKIRQLSALQQTLGNEFVPAAGNTALDALLSHIDRRRTKLTKRALLAGRRLYAEKPCNYVQRLHTYWLAWKKSDKETIKI